MKTAKTLAHEFVEAVSSSKPAGIMPMFAKDAWIEVSGSSLVSGWRKAAEMNPKRPLFGAIPKGLRLEMVNLFGEGNRAFCECHGKAVTSDGRNFESFYLFWVYSAGGKIVLFKSFMDTLRFNQAFQDDPQYANLPKLRWGVGPWASGGPSEDRKIEVFPVNTFGTGYAKYGLDPETDPAAAPKALVRLFAERLDSANPPSFIQLFKPDAWIQVGGASAANGYAMASDMMRRNARPLMYMYPPTWPNGISIKPMNIIGEGDQAVCEARGKAITRDGITYDNHYNFWLRAANEKIVAFKEFNDTYVYEECFAHSSMFNRPGWAGIGPFGAAACPLRPRPERLGALRVGSLQSDFMTGVSTPKPASANKRVARNLAIAKKFYDAHHNAPDRGELVGVFDPEDFADGWLFCSSPGGETRAPRDMAREAKANYQRLRKRLPDYQMKNFSAWPTDWGCAWRWRVTGHVPNDDFYEFWEQMFIWTNDEGKVTRFEIFDDWNGYPQTMAYARDVSLDELTKIKNYGKAPWTPPRPTNFKTPATPTPVGKRATRNLELAKKFYDAYHTSAKLGYLPEGVFMAEDFVDDCVMYSAANGERKLPERWTIPIAIRKRYEYGQITKILSDYKMDQFAAWPTDDGCAWRWLVSGRSEKGKRYEFWEQIYIWTNAEGKITRFEFFDDFLGFPQMLGVLSGLSLEDRWKICQG